jgi:hypothetical protein
MSSEVINPVLMHALNPEEICDIYLRVGNQIVTYFVDIILVKTDVERMKLHQRIIEVQWFFDMLVEAIAEESTNDRRFVVINRVTGHYAKIDEYHFNNDHSQNKFDIYAGMEDELYAQINPNSMIQLLEIVSRNCLSCLSNKLFSPKTVRLVEFCINKSEHLINDLQIILATFSFREEMRLQTIVSINRVDVQIEVLTIQEPVQYLNNGL